MDGTAGWVAPELQRAARLVLGRELGTGVEERELRSAFRRRALELHPDRAAALGRDASHLAEEFRALCAAYELLGGLAAGWPVPIAAPGGRAAAARPPAARQRPTGLPPRTLRFAEFLYYSGRISWVDLAEAIAWQRRAGRRIGQWFVERGLIHAGEVRSVREALARHNAAAR